MHHFWWVIQAIPVVGDLAEIITDGNQLSNMGWIIGKSCVAGNDGEGIGEYSIDWDTEGKYYQRFIEDQRIMESISDDYASVVTAFLDKYPSELEEDDSYEAILARCTGLSKETVVAVLDYMEYEKYVAAYNPGTKYAFRENTEGGVIKIENSKNKDTINMGIIVASSYWYDRNRYFAIA